MADNNNSNNLNNGGSSANRFSMNNKAPVNAEERTLLNNDKNKNSQVPIKNVSQSVDAGECGESVGTASTPVDPDNTDFVPLSDKTKKKKKTPRRALEAVYTHYEVSKKSRLPFLLLSTLSALLLIVLIVLIICWPRIPSYMKAEVCVEQECLDSSKQILGWIDTKQAPCDNAYKFSCGNFLNEYKNHEFYLMNKGEWNFKSYYEYEDLTAAHVFISKIPSVRLNALSQSMLKDMHSTCMNLITEPHDKENLQSMRSFINTAKGWRIFPDDRASQSWSLHDSLPIVQSMFGASPFFKVSVQGRTSGDGNIITISEGELGLPDEQFYTLKDSHPIIKAYFSQLQDIYSILVGGTKYDATTFVENLYNYEKRIVSTVRKAKRNGTATSQVMNVYDFMTASPSLPTLATLQGIFKNIKITSDTLILVHNIEIFKELSLLVSSSDTEILNDFVMWSLVRRFMPYMTRNFRTSLETFHKTLYGAQYSVPPWYFCTSLTKQWLSFGLEAFRQHPELIVTEATKFRKPEHISDGHYSDHLVLDKIDNNEEFLKMMFYHLRDELKKSIDQADWINEKLSAYINDRLSAVRLQIGIPPEVAKNVSYIDHYYNEFILNRMTFAENMKSQWNLEKKIMGDLLGTLSDNDRIIAELFSSSKNNEMQKIKYLNDLNMVIMSQELVRKPYYHYKYPISLNFARLGTDFAAILLEAAFVIGEQYKETILYSENQEIITQTNQLPYGSSLEGESFDCIHDITSKDHPRAPSKAKANIFSTITAGDVAQRAMNSLFVKIDNNEKSFDAELIRELNLSKRQNGLRQYDHNELFSLIFLQKHCSVIDDDYKHVKVLIEKELPEREIFNIMWQQIGSLSKSFHCSTDKSRQCKNIL